MSPEEFKAEVIDFISSEISPQATVGIDFMLNVVSKGINNRSLENIPYVVDILGVGNGNIGGTTVLLRVLNEYPVGVFEDVIRSLVSQNVYDSDVWVKYKNDHGEDLSSFVSGCLG